MPFRELHPTLRQVADRYPAFVRTAVQPTGLDQLYYDATFPLKRLPTDTELFGETIPRMQKSEGVYRRVLTALGVGEIVAVRQLAVAAQSQDVRPAKKFLGIRLGHDQPVTIAGTPQRVHFSDLVAGADAAPVSVLQYSTLSNGRTPASVHKDVDGHAGNYMNVAQTMPQAMTREAMAVVTECPSQARELARYIIEERIGISTDRYTFPDFQALAADNIDRMHIGRLDMHNWSTMRLQPVDPDW